MKQQNEPLNDNTNVILNCPHCEAPTSSYVTEIGTEDSQQHGEIITKFFMARCVVCKKGSVYVQKTKLVSNPHSIVPGGSGIVYSKVLLQKIIYPVQTVNPKLPKASLYMPDDVKALYNEASSVFDLSPRSSGALIRITLERLIKRHVLTDNTGRLNDMIGRLSTTFPDYILKLMDNIRNTGNQNAHDDIHEIKDDEDKDKIIKLFEFINWICELINLNKESDKMFNALPEEKRKAIKQRNQKNRDSK